MDGIGEFAPRTSKYRLGEFLATVMRGESHFVINAIFMINSHFSFFKNG